MSTDNPTTLTPAYLPWRTLTNTLEALSKNMPHRIDKTAFPGQSGAAQSQLLLAFRFFGFINEEGKPNPALHAVAVPDEAARKNALRKLIEQKYAGLIAMDLTKITPAHFAEKMTEIYNITGDTRLKATRFFLNAAEYLGIEVSQLLLRDKTKSIGNGAGATRRRRRTIERPEYTAEEHAQLAFENDDPSARPAESRSVQLKSGGVLTVATTARFTSMSRADREFVFELIDKLAEYEDSQA